MLDKSHAAILRPATLVVVSNNVVVGRIGVCTQVSLNKVVHFICGETEENMEPVNITRVQTDGVASLCSRITILQKLLGICGGPAISLPHWRPRTRRSSTRP